MIQCNVCAGQSEQAFVGRVLNQYQVRYYRCQSCGFLQVEEPYWLEEAYARPINVVDTGILMRNRDLSELMSVIIYRFFDARERFLDYGGGYGIFTRMMRDIGFDFYWKDPFCRNLFAEGFEIAEGDRVELVTSSENFEHFVKPLDEVEKILAYSDNILFTTQLLPDPVPAPEAWWYYGLEHGQHVSFYTPESLRRLAARFGLNVVSDGNACHLLSRKKISPLAFRLAIKAKRKLGMFRFVAKRMRSRAWDDMNLLLSRQVP